MFSYIAPKLTDVASRRFNLVIQNIQKSASAPYPASVFDAAAAVRYADMFNLSKEELRELE